MADPKQRFTEIVRKLKEHHHKLTPQRLAVVRVLARSDGHPSVEQVYNQIQNDFPTMSLATVYRNVMLLKSLGQVLELGFPDGSNRYDGNRPHPHPHMICTKCKKILDPESRDFEGLTRKVAAETGFRILAHRLDFFGICPECLKEEGKPPPS